MTYSWSNDEFTRKVQTIKDNLRDKDDFYDDTMLTRIVTKTGASGLYNRGMTLSHTDTLVSGLIVERSEWQSYEEDVMTIDTSVQFTCKAASKNTILNADELWLNYTLSGSSVTGGTMYKVKADRPTLFGIDHIFNLNIAGKQSA
jgi:hypothetical protein